MSKENLHAEIDCYHWLTIDQDRMDVDTIHWLEVEEPSEPCPTAPETSATPALGESA